MNAGARRPFPAVLLAVSLALHGACAPFFLPVDAKMSLDLSRAGDTAATEFQIRVEDDYVLELACMTGGGGEDAAAQYLMGGDFGGKPRLGAVLPLRLVLVRLSGRREEAVVVDRRTGTRAGSSVGAGAIYGVIAHLRLKPGKYRLTMTNLKDHPRLRYVPVEVFLRYDRR